MSSKSYEQQTLDKIKKRQINELNECPKGFFELISFMQANLRKQFKSFSLFNLCHGSSHKLRFNDPAFEKAFGSMIVRERLELYERAVEYGIEAFGKNHKTKQELDEMIEEEIRAVLPEGYKDIHITVHQGFRSNEQVLARIQKFKLSSRSHFSINLQNYIFRQSKKSTHPQNYILEAINKSHPERIRFSFSRQEKQAQDLTIIKKLSDLAFRNTVNSMMVPDGGRKSPIKGERRPSVRQSVGRLVEPVGTEKEFMPIEEVKLYEQQSVPSGKELLDFSRLLAEKKRQSSASKFNQNSNFVQQLLLGTDKNIKSNNQVPSNQTDNKQPQNIFNKILQTQSDIKIPYKEQIMKKQAVSPIRRLVSSEVQQYIAPEQKLAKKLYKNVFELMIPQFNLRQLEQSVSSKIFQQIYTTTISGLSTFTISQHKQRHQRFQCKLILLSLSIQMIYSFLTNQELLKKWNSCVDQSQIKITLSAQNCLICYQKHKRYSTWFKQRDYLFMRHAFVYKQNKYIADRSIEHNSFIPFQAIQRGYIRHKLTRLREISEGRVQLVVDMSIDQGGYLGVEKKKQMNLNFLKQYQKLQNYLTDNRDMITKMNQYCNLQWSIDWIDDTNQRLFPKSLSLKTQQFEQTSQIDHFNADNLDLQSQDFYSIQEIDQQSQQQTQPSVINTAIDQTTTTINTNGFKFQTTQGFEEIHNNKPFAKSTEESYKRDQLVEENQLSLDEKQAVSFIKHDTSILDTQIQLDDQGYCILPQKYFKKKHPLLPKQNYSEERHTPYQNIVIKGDFVQSKDGGILLVNKTKIDAQNNVINFIMKTMRKNLLSGKSILSISLPVEIFKEDSNTQRLCQSMAMGPHFLQKASQISDPLERMKLSICFGLSNSLMYFYIEKPFNPILGQTYQGMIDGCPIYAEQTSHHPPITSLYFVGRGYKVYASLQAKVFLHLNSGDGVNQGFYTIEFDDGHEVRFQTAPGELSGFTIGDRKYRFKDKMYVYDKKNSYFATLNFQDPAAGFFSKSKWQHPDQMQGEILKVTPSFITKFQSSQQKLLPKPKQISKTESKISGRWIHYLNFDGKQYYNIVKDIPYKLRNYEYALSSDARYREDLIYRMRNDLAKSQIYKENLENRQRKDRKLREQFSSGNAR